MAVGAAVVAGGAVVVAGALVVVGAAVTEGAAVVVGAAVVAGEALGGLGELPPPSEFPTSVNSSTWPSPKNKFAPPTTTSNTTAALAT